MLSEVNRILKPGGKFSSMDVSCLTKEMADKLEIPYDPSIPYISEENVEVLNKLCTFTFDNWFVSFLARLGSGRFYGAEPWVPFFTADPWPFDMEKCGAPNSRPYSFEHIAHLEEFPSNGNVPEGSEEVDWFVVTKSQNN